MPTIQTLQVGKTMRRIALLLLGWLMLTCAGVLDFLIKPIDADTLLAAITKALTTSTERQQQHLRQSELAARIALRTVKLHRQRAMEKSASRKGDFLRSLAGRHIWCASPTKEACNV